MLLEMLYFMFLCQSILCCVQASSRQCQVILFKCCPQIFVPSLETWAHASCKNDNFVKKIQTIKKHCILVLKYLEQNEYDDSSVVQDVSVFSIDTLIASFDTLPLYLSLPSFFFLSIVLSYTNNVYVSVLTYIENHMIPMLGNSHIFTHNVVLRVFRLYKERNLIDFWVY